MKVSNEFKVGALAVICVALLIIGYNILKGSSVFTSTDNYYAVYEAVDGLSVSNPVKIKGVQIGRVTDIALTNKVIVRISINHSIKLPRLSAAKIASPDLLGGKEIDIMLGTDFKYYKPGDTLISATEKSLTENVQAQILPVKEKAEALLGSIDSVLTIIKSVLNPDIQTNIMQSVKSISSTLNHINNSSASLDDLLAKNATKLEAIFSNVESITETLKKNQDNITAMLTHLNQITDTIAQSHIKQTIANAEIALQQVSLVLEKVNKGEGSLGLLVKDDKLYNNLQQSSKDLDLLFQDLKANPSRYVHISVFGKKEKGTATDAGQH